MEATKEHNGEVLEIDHFPRVEDIDHEGERKILKKIDRRLMPLLYLLLIVAFLDRTNIGNARLQGLEKDLNMKGTQFNIALFIFFVPYVVLDIPMNILMKKVRPSIYIGSLMVSWGIVTIGQGVTQSYDGLVVCRVLLGTFEAGFFPGAVYMLVIYYTRYELHKRVSLLYSAGTIASAFGGLFAYAIAHMDGVAGYRSWRWIFLIEGIATCLIGVLTIFALPDWPEQAKFLTEYEKTILLGKLGRDTAEFVETKPTLQILKDTVTDPKVILCSLMYFGTSVTGSASSFFLPTILRELGWTSLKAQYMSIPVWLLAFALSIVNGFASDKVQRRWPFFIVPLCFSVIGYALLIARVHVSVGVRHMAVFFLIGGCYAAIAVCLTWMNNNILGKKKRGIASAVVLGVGNCGSILGANVYLSSEAPNYVTGYSVSFASIILAQICAVAYFLYLRYENKARADGRRDHLRNLPQNEQDDLGDQHPSYRYVY